MQRNYRSLDEITEEYFTTNPEEIDDFLTEAFIDYAQDSNSAALLSTLRVVARNKGISKLATQVGMTRQGLQKALLNKGNPRFDNVILHALGIESCRSR